MSAEGFTKMSIYGMNMDLFSSSPIVILKVEDENRYLPIWIGAVEATAIAYEQQGVKPARPLTHDLLRDILAALKQPLRAVESVEMRDNIFYAELILDQNTKVSARVSDAIALALHLSIPIHAEDTVLDAAAVANTAIRAEGDDHVPEEVEEFRRFLDTASPEDFDPD